MGFAYGYCLVKLQRSSAKKPISLASQLSLQHLQHLPPFPQILPVRANTVHGSRSAMMTANKVKNLWTRQISMLDAQHIRCGHDFIKGWYVQFTSIYSLFNMSCQSDSTWFSECTAWDTCPSTAWVEELSMAALHEFWHVSGGLSHANRNSGVHSMCTVSYKWLWRIRFIKCYMSYQCRISRIVGTQVQDSSSISRKAVTKSSSKSSSMYLNILNDLVLVDPCGKSAVDSGTGCAALEGACNFRWARSLSLTKENILNLHAACKLRQKNVWVSILGLALRSMLFGVYFATRSKLFTSWKCFTQSECFQPLQRHGECSGPSQTDSNKNAILPTEATNRKRWVLCSLCSLVARMLHWHLQHLLILLSQPAFAAGSSFEGRMAPAPSPDLDFGRQNKSSRVEICREEPLGTLLSNRWNDWNLVVFCVTAPPVSVGLQRHIILHIVLPARVKPK